MGRSFAFLFVPWPAIGKPAALAWLCVSSACLEIDPNFQGVIATTTLNSHHSDGQQSETFDPTGATHGTGASGDGTSLPTTSEEYSSEDESSDLVTTTSSASESMTSNVDSSSDNNSNNNSNTGTTSMNSTSSSEETSTTSSSDTSDTPTDTTCEPTRCMALNDDRPFDNSRYVTAGRNAYRMRNEGEPHAIVRIEIYTGEVNANSRLGLWSSAGTNSPDDELASEPFEIQQNKGWQGVTFDEAVNLAADQYFWIVWNSVDNAQATIATSGTATAYRWRNGDSGEWMSDGSARVAMMRIYCCDP